MRFERAATAQKPIVENLLQLYMHDMSEWFGTTTDDRGRFSFIEYMPDDLVYLAFEDAQPAGVAIVTRKTATAHELEEFFLMRAFRHQGYGELFAAYIWNQLPGNWILRVFEDNRSAVPFWRRTISGYIDNFAEEREDVNGFNWLRFQFNNDG